METLCASLRKRIDASQARRVNLSVEEIQIRARHGAEHADQISWWYEVFRDPENPVHAALAKNNLLCILATDCGRVVDVEFF
jgi:hypothetical protein